MLCKINVRRAPNDVKAWLSYSELYENKGDVEKCLEIIDEGIKAIKADEVQNGMLSNLWIKLATIYQ